MMNLELNDDERTALADALDVNLMRLSDEIAHTDLREYREYLMTRRETLSRIRIMLH